MPWHSPLTRNYLRLYVKVMVARHRLYASLAVLGVVSPGFPLWALPPCGAPGTITTVTAPDGDYLAAFSDYKIYPPIKYETATGPIDKVAAPEYHSYYPQELAVGPQGRIYVADQTIIYRLETDGTATRIVGVPQYSISYSEGDYDYDRHPLGYDETTTHRPPLLQRFNVLEDTVAALDARIAPGAMAFDQQGRLYFVDQVNNRSNSEDTAIRIARLEPDGQVITFAGAGRKGYSGDGGPAKEAHFGYISSLVFDPEGNLLVADNSNNRIRKIDTEGVVTTLVQADRVGSLLIDGQGTLYYGTLTQVFRRHTNGTIEHVAGSDWGDPDNRDDRQAMYDDAVEGKWESEERFGGYFVANGRPATEAPFSFLTALAIDSEDALYIANSNFHRIHRVRPDGILETIAGNGLDYGFSRGCQHAEKRVIAEKRSSEHRCQDHIGDGGPALEAPIWWPYLLLLTLEGDLLVVMSSGDFMWAGGAFSQLRRICGISEWMVPTAVEVVEEQASASRAEVVLSALRLYPNPFNAAVTLTFRLEHSASVSVRIYDKLGQRVQVLAGEAVRPAGSYQFVWDGRDQAGQFQASGTYLLVLSVDGVIESHKLTLLH